MKTACLGLRQLPHCFPKAHPRILFESLFGEGGSPAVGSAALKLRASLFDSITEDLARLKRELGPADRTKTVQRLDSVREVEQRIQDTEAKTRDNPLPSFREIGWSSRLRPPS